MCPTYGFHNIDTGEEYELFLTLSEREEYLKSNPNVTQMVSAPALHSGRGMGKPDQGFTDLLKHIKKGNNKGITRSTINSF